MAGLTRTAESATRIRAGRRIVSWRVGPAVRSAGRRGEYRILPAARAQAYPNWVLPEQADMALKSPGERCEKCWTAQMVGDRLMALGGRSDAMQQTIALTVNGKRHEVRSDPDRPLLDVLREDLDLTGSKYGCGHRQCGACTVLLDGRPVFSCSIPVSVADKRKIETIEGVSDGDKLHPVQEAFLAEGALQ